MAKVTLVLGDGYIPDLKARMKRHGISQNMLARKLGINPSQASRWFTDNPKRRVTPEMGTIAKIEEAMAQMIRYRARR